MPEKLTLRKYQVESRDWTIKRLLQDKQKGVLLNLDCGLGKTIISLSVTQILKMVDIAPALVIAPLRPAKLVWPKEIDDWYDFDLSYSVVHGTPKKRLAALDEDVDVYIINYDNLAWLNKTGWNKARLLILDESTFIKGWSRQRTKGLRAMLPDFQKRILLSATPIANCQSEIFSQAFMMDDGDTLGRTKGAFQRNFMRPGGFRGKQWEMRPEMIPILEEMMAPHTYRLDAKDELDMPELIDNKVTVELPESLADDYDQLEKEMFLELESGDPLLAESGGSKYSACRQFVSGAIYHEDEDTGVRSVVHLHDEKVNTLKELDAVIPTPMLVLYWFRHSRARIEEAFPDCETIAGGVKIDEVKSIIDRWQRGEIKVLAAQISALGHGTDGLQKASGGRDIVFFDQCDSGDLDKQVVGRIYRSGQTASSVRVHRLVCKGTVDEAIYRSVKSKLQGQDAWNEAMKEYRLSKTSDYSE